MKKILVIEDDTSISNAVKDVLCSLGYDATNVSSKLEARDRLRSDSFDLALIDLNLPDGSTFDLCEEIRVKHFGLRFIVITANQDEDSAVRTFTLGAEDHIRKPFGQRELKLRLNRVLFGVPEKLMVGKLALDREKKTVTYQDQVIPLRSKEYLLLSALMEKPGRLLTLKDLISRISVKHELENQTLYSYLGNLRNKLLAAGVNDSEIQAMRGVGYRLALR